MEGMEGSEGTENKGRIGVGQHSFLFVDKIISFNLFEI
jgi:hypothetical protein